MVRHKRSRWQRQKKLEFEDLVDFGGCSSVGFRVEAEVAGKMREGLRSQTGDELEKRWGA
jgi:hypothetical protein